MAGARPMQRGGAQITRSAAVGSRLSLAAMLFGAVLAVIGTSPPTRPVSSTGTMLPASFVDPALANTGGPPPPPTPGVALTGGTFKDHGVIAYGDAKVQAGQASTPFGAPVVDMATTRSGRGYWIVAADGDTFSFGDATPYGSASAIALKAPIVAMASTPDDHGYWLVALDGGVFSFGDARFYGSMGGTRLNEPIVGIVASHDGGGYWEVAADGGIFSFGDVRFYGSTGGIRLYAPIVGLATTPTGRGYWEVASDGGVFTFGDAVFHGSMGDQPLAASMVGIARTPDGRGYWLAGEDGAVFNFGDAQPFGGNQSAVPTPSIAAIRPTPDGRGYWLLEPATLPDGLSDPPPGPPASVPATIVGAAATQLHGNPSSGYFCNPYGPCEEWCALFATWAWQQAGIPIPRYGFTGDIYSWASQHGRVLASTARPLPGDAVLYGTGPSSSDTSLHVGIVAQVWPDGAIVTMDGDAGPGPPGAGNVVMTGPFLPGDATAYVGMPIYAYAEP